MALIQQFGHELNAVDLNGVFTVSNFNLTLNEDGNYTMTYDLTQNRDLDLVWVEVKFYDNEGEFITLYSHLLVILRKIRFLKLMKPSIQIFRPIC